MFNSRLETTEERVSELRDQLIEHRLETKTKSHNDLWDNIKQF